MYIKHIREILEKLAECAKAQLDMGTDHIDSCEFGRVTDMIKDLSEAMYYITVTKEMENAGWNELMEMFEKYGDGGRRFYDHYRYADGKFAPEGHGTYRRGYEEPPYFHMTPEMYRDMDRDMGRMYFTESTMNTSMRDSKEGRSGMSRRAYMENKELHKANTPADKEAKVRDLSTYMKELASDLMEIINDSIPEEKTVLKRDLSALVTKIG